MSNGETQSAAIPGTVLAGKYKVERVLGQGGMGVVVAAHHIALDERVALKMLLPELATHPEASERFQREARAAVKIKSEHVARVSDVGTLESGAPYMVMELLEGADLSVVLATSGVLSLGDAVDYIVQGCEAIAEAHGLGIIHRDLKPANLFLGKRPDGSPLIKVLDFGISKVSGAASLTKTTASMGSALYMSPEQLLQARSVDTRTDIYALGVSLYELLSGRHPFYADTLPELCGKIMKGKPVSLRELRPDLPEGFIAVIEKSYTREREQRYPSIAAFVTALAPYALPRTATAIERIARMGGLPVPEGIGRASSPGSSVVAAAPMVSKPAINPLGGTQIMDEATWTSGASPLPPKPAPALVGTIPVLPAESAALGVTELGRAPLLPASPEVAAVVAQQQPGPPMQQVLPVQPQQQAVPEQQAVSQQQEAPQQQVVPTFEMHQILPGHYTGPMSTRAAAHFKMGALPPRPRRSGGTIVVVLIAVVALGIIAAAFAIRARMASQAPAPQPAPSEAAPSR